MSKKSDKVETTAQEENVKAAEAATEVREESAQAENSDSNNTEEVSEVEKLKAEVDDLKNQNLRLYAEFENFRKRNARERVELSTTANKEVLAALLPVLDDFKRALANVSDEEKETEVAKGLGLISAKLHETLKQKGLKPMENTVGKKFDVDFMEAITKIPAPAPDMAGKVIDEIEAGYMVGEKILRYAKVVVADGEPQS
ncbi:MAG: nucleotide exchange factor GrpE [Flavobacteriia bacterium]|nr:nucleotide exchange factor GrpE [Flavobacteriia bacterium]